ncbi:DUF3560 domain-containing protein [Escherichia coli O11:H15]|nr:DUF3560 domain-containing protein [Escherichia coli O11:H15]
MTAPEAASPVQMYRATYSPDDNKLRLYAASRLDPETYKKVHDAGFRWAPKQALFVAPAWTPGREDVLLSLAGEIEDEDSTLAERQEARADRFTGYSGKRASESAQALDEVERLAAMIPPGQPILVGHHSERRARRDAQRIENGMKRAVMFFERAEYWEERARSALLHAKYKERPDVRWRRIKKIEADLRKSEKNIAQSQKYLTMWRAESQLFVTPAPVCDRLVTLAEISNRDHILEPSAGTGAILRAIRDTAPGAMCDAVEINSGLVRYLRDNFNGVRVQCGDFMEWQPVQYYSRIIMNPPFSHGQDIRHILRAFSLLRPGGVLVAVCLNGPRQQEKLLAFSDVREELPRGTFAYTDVPTMIIRLRA